MIYNITVLKSGVTTTYFKGTAGKPDLFATGNKSQTPGMQEILPQREIKPQGKLYKKIPSGIALGDQIQQNF